MAPRPGRFVYASRLVAVRDSECCTRYEPGNCPPSRTGNHRAEKHTSSQVGGVTMGSPHGATPPGSRVITGYQDDRRSGHG